MKLKLVIAATLAALGGVAWGSAVEPASAASAIIYSMDGGNGGTTRPACTPTTNLMWADGKRCYYWFGLGYGEWL